MRFLKLLSFLILLFNITASAQLYYFGRNKVQYNKFDWKIIKTDHFDVYYYGEMQDIAQIGASYAEQAYDDLKVRLNTVVTRRVPIIFYNTHLQFEQTNTTPGFIPEGVGGFFEYIKGRVVIPFDGSLHDFNHVIEHELTHVFMTAKLYQILHAHRMETDIFPPLWFTEGLAEYMSTKLDDQARMVMRDAVLNNYFTGLQNIYSINGTYLMYKEGEYFLDFVREKYGKEKIPLLLDNIWMYSNFQKNIEYTLGKPIEEIDDKWTYYLKKKFYPLIENRVPIKFATKQLTDFGFNFAPVYYNLNGTKYIYFIGNRDGYSSLYRIKMEKDASPELILRGEKTEEFEAFHLLQSTIDVSKDGIIAFVTQKGGTDAVHFYSIKEDKIIKDFQREYLINISSPKFSSDCKEIVFHAIDQKGFSDIFLYKIDSDSLIRLTNDYYDDENPTFGLNDNQIIFSSDRTAGKYEKKYNIFSLDLSTHQINYVTYLNANNYSAIVSPKRDGIFITSDLDGVRNIYNMKIKNGAFTDTLQRVTNFVTSAFDPSFIDSSKIVFAGFEKFSFNLYTVNLDSTGSDTSSIPQNITMNFDSSNGIWSANKIELTSKNEPLKYEKHYTLDYAESQIQTDPIYGTTGGAVLSLSDLLSDDSYYFLIYNTAQVQSDILKSFNVEIEKVDLSKRTNYGFGVFNFSGLRYDLTESDEYFYERSFGGFFALNFPLSTFQRIEVSTTMANSDRQIETEITERKALLLSNTISYVVDNSLWGPTGPLDGIRGRLLLGYTGDVKYSNVDYFTVIADYRQYFRLGYTTALALRTSLYYNQGKEARRYFMGGSWDLRGWPRWSIRGQKMWISSLELRFPLIDQLSLKFPLLGLSFFNIRGAAYFDAGGAWDNKYDSTLGDLGFGFRMNLFGVLVLRYDIGKKIENNFTKFQKGLFYQFFFGWDF